MQNDTFEEEFRKLEQEEKRAKLIELANKMRPIRQKIHIAQDLERAERKAKERKVAA